MSGSPTPQSFRISVTDFALPCPRTGSIDIHSGFGKSALIGTELHQAVQRRRSEQDDQYSSEIPITEKFESHGNLFVIHGRMDGVFSHAKPKIEEIKSSFNVFALLEALKEKGLNHPYCLQLLTYGYFYYLQNDQVPDLTFHLISSRNQKTLDYAIELNLDNYRSWLDLRLDELGREARQAEKRLKRRKKAVQTLTFPFESPRPGQIELIQSIEEGMSENKKLLIQAPTGLGKTTGVLFPVLKEALSRGQRVVYVTPKNSQHAVAEDAVKKMQEGGTSLKSLTVTAKSKMCLKDEAYCSPSYCEYAKDYYDKVAQNGLKEKLLKKKNLTSRVFKTMGRDFEVCPFELQFSLEDEPDTLICDYNYAFTPYSVLARMESIFSEKSKPNLVIDEAHNLPSRSMSYYSPVLSVAVLEKILKDLSEIPRRFRGEASDLCREAIALVKSACRDFGEEESKTTYPLDSFLMHDFAIKSFLSKYLNSDCEIRSKDPVMRFCFYWGSFTEVLEIITSSLHPEFFITAREEALKITCCDASAMLKPCYTNFQHVIAFSATLKPFDFYAKLIGLEAETLKTAEFQSPFSNSNRKLLIIPQVSTKFTERDRNVSRIAEAIARISALRLGNYFAFFPSFSFLDKVWCAFQAPPGFSTIRQTPYSRSSDIESLLEELRSGSANIIFAVQGGVYSEGVDYPGNMLIGSFIIGPPLPNVDPEREGMREYYEKNFKDGFNYAYRYPAMAKAVQAAGRVIRSPSDRGVIVLMDSRFLERDYALAMPKDWFENSPVELVSDKILKDVSDFWSCEPK